MKITKEQAAYVLTDEIWPALADLEVAEYLLQEIEEEYFDKLSADTEEGRFSIACGFPRNKVLTSVVRDYLFRLRQKLDELHELSKTKNDQEVA